MHDRYIVDAMLGNVAKKLRMLGYDAIFVQHGIRIHDVQSLDQTLVTRSRPLLATAARLHIPAITGSTEDSIMRRILDGRHPTTSASISRCTICNGITTQAAGCAPAGAADPRTWKCTSCGHIYWDGSHMAHLRKVARRWT